jgi:hypothetical protein
MHIDSSKANNPSYKNIANELYEIAQRPQSPKILTQIPKIEGKAQDT